jgi:regulator of cell morphogenesis and NO signaling
MMDEFDCSISDIVRRDYRTAEVFKKYQIGFCCGDAMTLKNACEAKGINPDRISAELKESERTFTIPNSLPYDEWKIDFLIDFITHIHHTFIYRVIQPLSVAFESFTQGHKTKYPELTRVAGLFAALSETLLVHSKHEDDIIFPYIRQIESVYRRKEPYGKLFVRTLRKPLHLLAKEHFRIEEMLNNLDLMTANFNAPDGSCLQYHVFYKKLEEIYNHLVQYKYLEQTLLLPRAIAIERELLQL